MAQPSQNQRLRAALGDVVQLGTIYDARTDKFLPETALSAPLLPEQFVAGAWSSQGCRLSSSSTSHTYADKFDNLNIDAELAASILAGMVTPRGSSACLSAKVEDDSTIQVSLYHRESTWQERMDLGSTASLLNQSRINATTATHVVVRVDYGLQTVVVASRDVADNINPGESRLQMRQELMKLTPSIDRGQIITRSRLRRRDKKPIFKKEGSYPAQAVKEEENEHDSDSSSMLSWEEGAESEPASNFTIFSDHYSCTAGFSTTSIRNTSEDLASIHQQVQIVNAGKGVPLLYGLLPISEIWPLESWESTSLRPFFRIDTTTLATFIKVFDEWEDSYRTPTGTASRPQVKNETRVKAELDGDDGDDTSSLYSSPDLGLDVLGSTAPDLEFVRTLHAEAKNQLSQALSDVRSGSVTSEAFARTALQLSPQTMLQAGHRQPSPPFSSRSFESLRPVTWEQQDCTWGVPTVDSVALQLMQNEEELYVLYCQKQHATLESDSWLEQLSLLQSVRDLNSNTTVALTFQDHEQTESTAPHIVHVSHGNQITADVYGEYHNPARKSLVCFDKNNLECPVDLPTGSQPLRIACPGRHCDEDARPIWRCCFCFDTLHFYYGLAYCKCGRVPCTSLKFRCAAATHEAVYIKYGEGVLENLLDNIPRTKQSNILIIGEDKVGKSTFINALQNYLSFDSLDQAVAHDPPLWTAPCSVMVKTADVVDGERRVMRSHVIFGEDIQRKHDQTSNNVDDDDDDEDMTVGDDDDNGNGHNDSDDNNDDNGNEKEKDSAHSTCQAPQVYKLEVDDHILQIIDTPGITNVGTEGQKEIFGSIIEKTGQLGELHGILVLLDPTAGRMDVELLVDRILSFFPRRAVQTLIFGFTKTPSHWRFEGLRETLTNRYKRVGTDMKLVNGFEVDLKSFRTLAQTQKAALDPSGMDRHRDRWRQATVNMRQLMSHIATLDPVSCFELLDFQTNRKLVLRAMTALRHVQQSILDTITTSTPRVTRTKRYSGALSFLSEKLVLDQVVVRETQPHSSPMICANAECTVGAHGDVCDLFPWNSVKCHLKCHLLEVAAGEIGHEDIEYCEAMDGGGSCETCGHSWKDHARPRYVQEHVRVDFKAAESTRRKVLRDWSAEKETRLASMSSAYHAAKLNAQLEKFLVEAKKEEQQVVAAGLELALWLKNNSITLYADVFEMDDLRALTWRQRLPPREPWLIDPKFASTCLGKLKIQPDRDVADDSFELYGEFLGHHLAGTQIKHIGTLVRYILEFDSILRPVYDMKYWGDNLRQLIEKA